MMNHFGKLNRCCCEDDDFKNANDNKCRVLSNRVEECKNNITI
jgi:hypothetical protein